nr:hypothetical protein [Streptomyces sp. SID4936]
MNTCRNVSIDPVQTFEKGMIAEVERIADTLCAITSLEADQARAVVTTASSMAGALWPMAAPGTSCAPSTRATPGCPTLLPMPNST